MPPRYPFRAFICYSHQDGSLAATVQKALEQLGWRVLIDRNFSWGQDFHDAIKTSIVRSHLFVPILTRNSQSRPWVHQEIGFAAAVGVAVMPIVADKLTPSQLIGTLHAAPVSRRDSVDRLRMLLSENRLETLALGTASTPSAVTRIARYPEERTLLLAQYADEIRDPVYLRQNGGISSFSIPNSVDPDVWRRRQGEHPESDFHRDLLLQERSTFERHARQAGASLVFSPLGELAVVIGKEATAARAQEAVDFLKSLTTDEQPRLEVRFQKTLSNGNVTILGNWFCAESLAPRASKGYWQTMFTWHAASVQMAIDRFDRDFARLEPVTLPEAIERLRDEIRRLA